MKEIVLLALPAVVVLFFVGAKMPPNLKDKFFKCPIWITSTIAAILIGHITGGVAGPIQALLCDLVLMPGFSIIKRLHERRYGKVRTLFSRPKLVIQTA